MSVRVPLVVCLILAAAACAVERSLGEPARTPAGAPRSPAKLAPPPKWDRAVLETFFTDARERLGPGPAPGGQPGPEANPDKQIASPAAPGNGVVAASDGTAHWSAVVAAASLEDEVKAQVTPLGAAVQSPTEFKGRGYKAAREDFTLLAVLFAVISEYDGEVRWKKEAPSLRESFARAGMNCKVGTDNSFSEARLRSGDLAELVRGGTIELRPADGEFAWPAVANRPPLMKRMERSLRERLDPWLASGSEFRKNREAIVREAQLLGVLARVIKAEGYEYADDASYREYVDRLEQSCRDIIAAAQSSELPKAQSAAAQLNKTCDACHGDFRA